MVPVFSREITRLQDVLNIDRLAHFGNGVARTGCISKKPGVSQHKRGSVQAKMLEQDLVE